MEKILHILVVDDDPSMTKTLVDILDAKGYRADMANSGPEALEKLDEVRPDFIISDIKMPDVNGVALYRNIKSRCPDLPVVLMTAYSDDQLVQEGLEAGVIAALSKPLNIRRLLDFLAFLQQERTILIVDDDPKFCLTLGEILRHKDFSVTLVNGPAEVLGSITASEDIVLLDMKLNSVGGIKVLRDIRQHYPNLPVILITGHQEEMEQAIETALELGAHTCLYKPFNIEQLMEVLTDIQHRQLSSRLK